MDFLIGISLLVLGCSITFYLLSLYLTPIFGEGKLPSIFKISFNKKLRSNKKKLLEVGKLIEQSQFDDALVQIKDCIDFKIYKDPKDQVDLHSIYQSIISYVLIIIDEKNSTSRGIAEFEDLLLERVGLMKTYFENKDTLSNLSSKRKKEGKSMPEWSKKEYQAKITEAKNDLKDNETRVRNYVDSFFNSIITEEKDRPIVH